MKRLMAAMVVVMMVGCGGTDTTRSLDEQQNPPGEVRAPGTPAAPDPGTPATPDPEVTQQGTPAMLRLKGVNLGDYSALLAQVRSVEVSVDGVPRQVRIERDTFDLGRGGHAWKLASFSLPEGAREVSVSLAFDDFGGYEGVTGAGLVDFRSPPLSFSAPAEWFVEHGHAVVHLEVSRSLADHHHGRLLLPSFEVHY